MDNQKQIAEQYKEFWNTAVDLAQKEVKTFPLERNETLRDRATKHLVGMLSMYGYEDKMVNKEK
jgi:hypothetical protein